MRFGDTSGDLQQLADGEIGEFEIGTIRRNRTDNLIVARELTKGFLVLLNSRSNEMMLNRLSSLS